jgi:iron-sulfur cluster assembly protein
VDIGHDCGGALACASCRVLVHEGLGRLREASEEELDMLERAGELIENARLACQVKGVPTELSIEIPRREAPRAAAVQPLTVSARAARHLAAQLVRYPGATAVRLSVERRGCSGFAYRVDPAQSVRESDAVFESCRLRVVVDAQSLPYVYGTLIDLAEQRLARRLRFDNPNARQSCGCGESFGV